MHGIGNDYVYVDGFAEAVDDPADVAAKASRPALRHRRRRADPDPARPSRPTSGCGCSTPTAAKAEMCGNGVRCVAKYAFDHGLAQEQPA